ncbi:MAG TPA: peptidoglycan bridge formation glycyltransferase FemA/FemB family protein [Patescibacteria group bacterium]|nr:peptidoglycan bridge formation glycyltransferase FemA/FemB family protein [Patescibacteria group bacterium]
MATVSIKGVTDKNVWEQFVAHYEGANFLQSWYWGDFHTALNKKIARTGFYKGGTLTGVMLSVVEKAKRATYLTVPAGPLIDWNDKKTIEKFVAEIKRIAGREKCSFVRVRPQLLLDDFSKNLFSGLGFRPSPIHLTAELTSQLTLSPSEETLLANMRKGTRYEINKAKKIGIHIQTTNEPSAIQGFYELQLQTAKRQNFVPFSYAFLHEQFTIFAEAKKALLYSAYMEKDLLAQAFIIFYGEEAAYHYGASTDLGRKYPGVYLIQWEAIKEAKKRGLKRYNFWGVAPEKEINHRFAGVSLFKRGFGGSDIEYLHAQDFIINAPKYAVNYIIEKWRKHYRRV